jgi:cation transport ATPase
LYSAEKGEPTPVRKEPGSLVLSGSVNLERVLQARATNQIAQSARLGRRTVRIARKSIWVGIGLSVLAMIVAAFGYLPPTAGAILQEGIDAPVILHAHRGERYIRTAARRL